MYDCVVRSLRSHPRIDPVTKPAEGARDQKPDQKPQQKQKPDQEPEPKQEQKPDQKIAAFGSSYSWIAHHSRTGRLSGRLREQARSHKSKSKKPSSAAARGAAAPLNNER
nr:hypothetical protein FEE99_08625 [Pseudomonas sp. ef1]